MNHETHKIYKYLCKDPLKYKYLQKYKIAELNRLIPELYPLIFTSCINTQLKNNYHRIIQYKQTTYIRIYLNLLNNRIDIFFDCKINDPNVASKTYLLEEYTNLTRYDIVQLDCYSFNKTRLLPIQLFKIKNTTINTIFLNPGKSK